MHSQLNQSVARALAEDRARAARGRAQAPPPESPPPRLRRSAAEAAVRLARRLDAEAVRRRMA